MYGNFLSLHPKWLGIRSREGDYLSGTAGANPGRVLDLPVLGLQGNSHFLMMDNNNLQIADIIYDW